MNVTLALGILFVVATIQTNGLSQEKTTMTIHSEKDATTPAITKGRPFQTQFEKVRQS
jgi:hypothetical protein